MAFGTADALGELEIVSNGAEPTGNRGRLLIVEDELLVAQELAAVLRQEGWEVCGPAGSIEEAFKLLEDVTSPDAAILDINLNGQFVYPIGDRLRVLSVPYLFCTGYESVDNRGEYPDSPIVQKPTNLRVLTDELERLLGESAPAPQGEVECDLNPAGAAPPRS